MIKKRYFNTKHDFKTGFYFRLSFVIGIFLLLLFIFFKGALFFLNENSTGFLRDLFIFSRSSIIDSIGAISIILIAFGFIIYFLYLQFVKLDEIAKEVEEMASKEE